MKRIHLRKARESKGWTQQQLADASNLPQARISALENSVENPTFDTVLAIAAALELDPRVLRFGQSEAA